MLRGEHPTKAPSSYVMLCFILTYRGQTCLWYLVLALEKQFVSQGFKNSFPELKILIS